MSSSKEVFDLALGSMTVAAERRKKRTRSVRKRKFDEVSDSTAPVLPPVIEVEEISASQTSQEELAPVSAQEIRADIDEDIARAPSSELPSGNDPGRKVIQVEMRESDSAINNPWIARMIMKAVVLPSDKLEIKNRPLPNILEHFSSCVAQTNTIFESLREKLAEREEEELRIQRLESEKREAAMEEKFQAFVKESTEEYQLLQDELVRVNGLLRKSEEEARHSNDALKSLRARCKNSEERRDKLEKDLEKAKDLAISEYKKSEEFVDMLGDVTFPMFFDGFEDCKSKVSEQYPQLDLSSIVSKFGTKEEILGGGDEEDDEAREEDPQEKPQEDPAPQKGKAVAADVAGPSSEEQLPVAPEDLELPDV